MNVTPVTVTTKNPFPPLSIAKQPQPAKKKYTGYLPTIGAIAGAAVSPHAMGRILPRVLTPDAMVKLAGGDKKTTFLYGLGMSLLCGGVALVGAIVGKGIEKVAEKIKSRSSKNIKIHEPRQYPSKTQKN